MAKTKAEKITSIEEEIRQLENKKKRLIQEAERAGAQGQDKPALQAHGAF